jgi:hypothetical protein
MIRRALMDKGEKPDDARLAEALGDSFALWTSLKTAVAAEHGPVVEEWKYYGAKSGWSMKLLRGARNLFFLIPGEGAFTLGFIFGDKAVAAVERSGLPKPLIAELRAAKKYAEGRGLRLEIRTRADAGIGAKLVGIKLGR